AMKVADEVPNISGLSNVVSAQTPAISSFWCPAVTPSTRAQANIAVVQQMLPQLLHDADTYEQDIQPYADSPDPNVRLSVDAIELSIHILRSLPRIMQCDPEAMAYGILPQNVTKVQNGLPYFYGHVLDGTDPYTGKHSGVVPVKSPIDGWTDFYYYSIP